MTSTAERQVLTAGATVQMAEAGTGDQPETRERNGKMDDKCKMKILLATNIILVIIIIIIVLCGVYAEAFAKYYECEFESTTCSCHRIEYDDQDAEIPDGNEFDFDTTVCEGYRDLWQDPSIALNERNQIGRAIFQTPKKMQQAIEHIKYGKSYNLYRPYSSNMPFSADRYFNTTLHCLYFTHRDERISGACTQEVVTDALGNVGTQFDGFGHFFRVDIDNRSSVPEQNDFLFFNNFRGDDVFDSYLGENNDGMNYLGVDRLPMFFSRAILVDVAGYKNMQHLANGYSITVSDFTKALEAQSLSVDNITKGDVVLVYTGWSVLYDDYEAFLSFDETPGLAEEVVLDILIPRNVMIIGSDNWGVDAVAFDQWGAHRIFLTCAGGFIHELLKLDDWVMDARKGDVPWIGAYLFQPLPVVGAVASPGAPVVFV